MEERQKLANVPRQNARHAEREGGTGSVGDTGTASAGGASGTGGAATERVSTVHVNTERTWRGGEQQTLYLLEGLARRGHPVILCAQAGGELEGRARAAGIETRSLSMRGEADPAAIWRLSRLFRAERPAIVHCHTSHAHSLAVAAARLVGRGRRPRTILSRRVDFSIYRHSFFGLNGLKYRLVDRIIAISERVREVLLEDGVPPERIDVVPSGIDPQRFAGVEPHDLRREFGLPPETVVVVNVAYFADHKGQRYLVEAAPRIVREFPAAVLFLVGEGELREPLIDLARRLGVAKNVFFPGFRREIPAILRGADICVMPSHLEGLGTSVLDALACGLPVVAARAGGIPEMIEDGANGLLVPPRDPEALAGAILRLLRDPGERRRLGAAGPGTVLRRFTADTMVEGNLAVYRRLLGASPQDS
jgi:glycosyltransferase involved in cell wall biosynthesis